MSIINCFSANTGLKIDAIVENYYAYAGENISAGDFVEFVNVYTTHQGQSNYFSLSTPVSISACLIDQTKFVVAYYNVNGTSNKGILKIGTVSSNTITFGSDYIFDNVADYVYMSKLDTDKFIIVYKYSYNIKAIACTISGATISFGTSTTVFTGTGSGVYSEPKVVAISTTKAVAVSSRGGIYGSVLTIGNDLSITAGTIVGISSNNGSYLDICELTSTKLLITYNDGGYSDGKAGVITVSGTNITVHTQYSFLDTNVIATSVCTLANNKVFIMYIKQTSYTCCGIIGNISGNTVTFSDPVVIDDTGDVRNLGYDICSLSSDKVVLAYTLGSTQQTRTGIIRTALISQDDVITIQNYLIFSNSYTESPFILQSANNVIILSYDTYYNGTVNQGRSCFLDCTLDTPSTDIIDSVETQVRQITTSQFNGIAKTKGTGGDQIKVYVPDI